MGAIAIVHPKLAKASFEKAIQPLLAAPDKFETIDIKLITYLFPYLDVELQWLLHGMRLHLRVDGTDFPYRPVGGWWVAPDGTALKQGLNQVPQGSGFHTANQDGKPSCWFCFKGWREYHDHQSHQDVSWPSIRRDPRYSVLQLITQLNKDLNGKGVTKV